MEQVGDGVKNDFRDVFFRDIRPLSLIFIMSQLQVISPQPGYMRVTRE